MDDDGAKGEWKTVGSDDLYIFTPKRIEHRAKIAGFDVGAVFFCIFVIHEIDYGFDRVNLSISFVYFSYFIFLSLLLTAFIMDFIAKIPL